MRSRAEPSQVAQAGFGLVRIAVTRDGYTVATATSPERMLGRRVVNAPARQTHLDVAKARIRTGEAHAQDRQAAREKLPKRAAMLKTAPLYCD
ncbi:MAG: hypothetical protein NZ739_11185 [Verrucomicrobiae bacterium]|nr:hypothetical protein [Verrucomicrobiae bacterium]MCX7722067.1 hypothetical protein [Verrucomicrobiae bacterium]MDW7980488.1 hypothetical protein [Verrucomicrobiales bacterium]